MLKVTEKPDKFKRAIIVSAVFHIILIAFLVRGAFHSSMDTDGGNDGGLAIDAVMIDPNAVVEQYNRQQQQSDTKRVEQLRKKQVAEQQPLKKLEKERLQTKEDAKQQVEVADAKKKAEEEVKKQAGAAAVVKKQAEEKAMGKAATDKKAVAEVAAQSDSVDNLLDDLASSKNAPKLGAGAPAGAGAAKRNGASGAALDNYGGQLRAAIQSKFYDWQLYRGKTCTLRIKLALDGLLISVEAESGDPALCQAAIAAAKQAKIPRPPSTDVYEAFKNAPIDFKPQ
ncbi:MAG: cell envelope integrity protein TolA [Symbiopectobacterium sp.]